MVFIDIASLLVVHGLSYTIMVDHWLNSKLLNNMNEMLLGFVVNNQQDCAIYYLDTVNPRITPGSLFAKLNFWWGLIRGRAYSRGGLISTTGIFLKG